MESIACGTPVVTFNTGGSGEMIDDSCGAVVPKNDIDALEREIIGICTSHTFDVTNSAKHFEQKCAFERYVELYENRDQVSD